ncbi:GNAT family N-acetyltransferase [Lentilactobacillus diolivorans]|uniref:Acetyltransferase n=2 Tax=Lentilactobacillus diolivorans TaxID=179838 RepID=A0A0R1S007_9LACO|nr:GNAT family N-acetyltransferase [Lentilactobacillus diolivorans]KRL62525.1 acetyltransferase [Lentilactobacillus diolivorans DSM 14421]GEP24562.1 putative N-acetyltransferase YycN [Lentilactobacillus diolivorans]
MLKLVKMTAEMFKKYQATAVKAYAAEKVKAGTWQKDEALQRSQLAFQSLLPDGFSSKNNYFYMIQNNTQPVGMVWLAQYHENSDKAFIYDIQIYPDFQNQGFGTQALKLIATQAKALGFKSMGLHVFGHNKRAIHVYEKSGFQPTDISMEKDL